MWLLDKNIRQIETFFEVEISNRGNSFKISGENNRVADTSSFIEKIYSLSENEEITPKQLHLYLNNSADFLSSDDKTQSSIKLKKSSLNLNQIIRKYLLIPLISIP